MKKLGSLFSRCGKETAVEVCSFYPQISQDALFTWAAAAEQRSRHPVGKALSRAYREQVGQALPAVEDFQALPGQGVRAVVNGVELLVGNLDLLSACRIAVSERDEARYASFLDQGRTVVYLAAAGRAVGLIALAAAPQPDEAEGVAAIPGIPAESLS
jgi:cation transport ATPase